MANEVTKRTSIPERLWTHTDALLYLVTALVSSIVTWFAIDLKGARLNAPFEYNGDALATGAHFKTVLQTGWYEYQGLLGAPYGQTYNDFPTADNLHLVVANIIGLFTDQWPVALNVYYIIGFPLAALGAVWFFRTVGVSRALTVALATAFAVAPYHFMRGEGHLWLASYYAVPLGAGLLVILLSGGRLWGRGRSQNKWLAVIFSPTSRSLLFTTLLASSGSYYGIFFLVLLAFAGIAVLIRDGSWARFWGAAGLGAFTAGVMFLNMLPDILYGIFNGANAAGLARSAPEAEIYALKLTQLIMPWPGHRIPELRHFRELYDNYYPLLSERPALGALGALGLVIGFLTIAYLAIARRRTERDASAGRGEHQQLLLNRVGDLGGLLFVAFLFATVGGLSTVISFFTSSLRGWNRMSIVMLILALGIVGLVLDRLIANAARRFNWRLSVRAVVAAGMASLLLVVAFVDQTPSDVTAGRIAAAKAFDADTVWIDTALTGIRSGSMILQLPYVPFPESSSVTGVLGSEGLIPYLLSENISWSAGGIKGRPRSDYPLALEQYRPEDVANLAAASGFAGIMVDRNALPDHAALLEAGWTSLLGHTPLVSESERFTFFNLQDLAKTISETIPPTELESITRLITQPVTGYFEPDFESLSSTDGLPEWGTALSNAKIRLTNTTTDSVSLEAQLTITADPKANLKAWVDGQGSKVPVTLKDGVGTVRLPVSAAPGTTNLHISGLTGPITVSHLRLVPDEVVQFLGALRSSGAGQ
ncbi:hypothetical protein [Cryobacterium sp. TMT1-66-1]|uniref:hypothetical protein n=1 Tax=Cryobacterium sp. TMT1-66-1 TaxID=1259242 RepID=UPI00106C4CD7|nr:hypothetical protein [Cryobacterium sp. TMT1-66-1]TFD10273.1 hypothetical protein E3T29_01100 [Cryobacterium sp. TMT1-66-1]